MIDGTLINTRAWMKSFGPKDGSHDQLEERELTLLMRERCNQRRPGRKETRNAEPENG
jgi:hypothetical protein